MIIITISLVEEMLANAVHAEKVGATYDVTANSMTLKSTDFPTLEITVISKFTDYSKVRSEIRMGETDCLAIYNATSSINENYGNGYFQIDCDIGFWLDKEAEEFLFYLQEKFDDETASYTIDHIDYEIDQHRLSEELEQAEH